MRAVRQAAVAAVVLAASLVSAAMGQPARAGAAAAGRSGPGATPVVQHLVAALGTPVDPHLGVRDDQGASMDTLKVLQVGPSRYLGTYQDCVETCDVRLAVSTDLVRWHTVAVLDRAASQPYLARDGRGYLLAVESDDANHLRLWHFRDLPALMAATPDRRVDLPRTLSACAEGTPAITAVRSGSVSLEFHYFDGCRTDREATGTLTGWSRWSARPDTTLDQALERAGAQGNHGARAPFEAYGTRVGLVEAQLVNGDWSSWRIFLSTVGGGVTEVPIATPGGSVAFANPAVTSLVTPSGERTLLVSVFLPSEGVRGADPAGEMTYLVPLGVTSPHQ